LGLYQATADLKKYAEKLISPGVSWRDYEIAVEEKAGELLKNLGLIKTLDRKSIREFYPHATSHLLGLDVHDVGDYRSPMQKNMVITIEPGFYSKSHGFGMRIEDDYLITENGVVNLTGDLSSELR
jgi:Xaa-Pro aminopeptidase